MKRVSLRSVPTFQGYDDISRWLDSLGGEVKVAGNGYVLKRCNGEIVVTLYRTRIVRYFPDGTLSFSTGGWHTHTTRYWLQVFSPWSFLFYSLDGAIHVHLIGCEWYREVVSGDRYLANGRKVWTQNLVTGERSKKGDYVDLSKWMRKEARA